MAPEAAGEPLGTFTCSDEDRAAAMGRLSHGKGGDDRLQGVGTLYGGPGDDRLPVVKGAVSGGRGHAICRVGPTVEVTACETIIDLEA